MACRCRTNYRHMPDPFVSLAAAAAVTSRIRFGTNVCVLPQHDPITLAETWRRLIACPTGG